ncbi:hypothetical protein B0H11DRAFT_1935472 [Mycena galericulata]|nr:hypothetical protein B0H11DRAFT_1935472 [Mycena galericulata]
MSLRKILRVFWKRKPHPISSLPPEIISKIFVHCLPPDDTPPAPQLAPLLIAQICRHWRAIALGTPELWMNIYLIGGLREQSASLELLKLWVSRAESLPLKFALMSQSIELGKLLLETAMEFQQQWEEIAIVLPAAAYSSLRSLADATFPVLTSIWFQVPRRATKEMLSPSELRALENIVMRAQRLRDVDLASLPFSQYFPLPHRMLDIPWNRLNSLVAETRNSEEGLSLLQSCNSLTILTLRTCPDSVPYIPRAIASNNITLAFLLDLTIDDPSLSDIFDHLTLPSLTSLHLILFGSSDDFQRMQRFFSRSNCPLQTFRLGLRSLTYLRGILALTPSVTGLGLAIAYESSDKISRVATALRVGVLPLLRILYIEDPTKETAGRHSLDRALAVRCGHNGHAVLQSLTLHNGDHCSVDMTAIREILFYGVSVRNYGGGKFDIIGNNKNLRRCGWTNIWVP